MVVGYVKNQGESQNEVRGSKGFIDAAIKS